MTLEELERYRFLVRESQSIERQLYEFSNNLLPSHDSNGSHSSSPGSPVEAFVYKRLAILQRLERKQAETLEAYQEIESWLETVEDPEIRGIIRYRYLLGYKWKKVSMLMYSGYADEDTPRKKIGRFFQAKVLRDGE